MESKYVRLRRIRPSGRGPTFGVAYKYRHMLTNEAVVGRSFMFDSPIPKYMQKNLYKLKEMQHPNIARLLDVACGKRNMEVFVEAGYLTLVDFMKKYPEQSRDPHAIKIWLHQILSGVKYCQSHGIVYQDLSPLKCSVDVHEDDVRSSEIKLVDAGFAWVFGYPLDTHVEPVKSYWYEAPEIWFRESIPMNAVDMWSVGCIFAEMVNQRPLLSGENKIIHLVHISRLLGTPRESIWPEGKECLKGYSPKDLSEEVKDLEPAGVDLLSKMLRWEPMERITADDALKHPYFDDLEVCVGSTTADIMMQCQGAMRAGAP